MADMPPVDTPARPAALGEGVRPVNPPAPSPGGSHSLLPTNPSDPLYEAYRNGNHPQHQAAVDAVHARFVQAHGGPKPWRDDSLERPGLAESRAPYRLVSPDPHRPVPANTLQAATNALHAVTGRQDLAQAALDYLEGGPADRLPELPPDFRPPDPSATLSELRRGWGSAADENLRLARAVVDVYDRQKQGVIREYLNRTGLGNHPHLIRLAARTAREWMKAGWRP